MRIRQRLIGLLVGMLSLGAVVAMFPSGSEAAGRPAPAAAAKSDPDCTALEKLVAVHLKIVGRYLDDAQEAQYGAVLDDATNAACNGTFTCDLAQQTVADLRAIRGTLLPPRLEAQVRALENRVVQLVCSS